MIEDMVVPMMVIEEMGKVDGKTRLQKLMCLACADLKPQGFELSFSFQLYRYGPFSFDLATTLNQLVMQGLVQEDSELVTRDRILHVYRLTKYGQTFLGELLRKNAVDKRVRQSVSRIVSAAGSLPLPELVARAYEAFPMLQSGHNRT